MLNRKPSTEIVFTFYLQAIREKAAVTGQDGLTASPGLLAHHFCFSILVFGPIEIKATDLTHAFVFSNMYDHNAFNF